jgi:CDP-4-dehydro-6-deoxyglucose reductase, E1
MDDKVTREKIRKLLKQHFSQVKKERFIPGKTKIPLNIPSYDWPEVDEAIECFLSTYVVMGKKVKEFEDLFAKYIGVRHAIMVQSGSSANLLALSILTNPMLSNRIMPGDEIITPAVTWATTVYPIMNVGAVPVLVDVDLETFDIKPSEIEKAITGKTRALMPVHLLGNPCDMTRIMDIARKHKLMVIEDSCEAHGASINGQKVGSFGDMGTFSFFFSHHISTIEGGMVVTNNDEYAELARALRVFGWVRDLKDKDKIAAEYPDFDPRYLFVTTGFNLRPTEIQGAFGIHQIGKLDKFIEIRRQNAQYWSESLKKYSGQLLLHEERKNTRHVWFGYPITVKPGAGFTWKELAAFLEAKGLETRPVMVGNMDEQPAMKQVNYRKGELPNSRYIMRNSFFFGNHHGIGREEREAIAGYVKEFMDGHK